MNKFLFGTAVAALALTASASAPAQAQRNNNSQILIVDVSRVSRECTACVAASQQLQSQGMAFQQRQQALSQQLQTAGQPIETAINALNGKNPDAALQARITAFENQRNAAAQEIQRSGQMLQSTEAHVNQQISARLRTVVESIRAQRNAAVVLAASGTLAFNNAIDVTSEALTQLNQQLPSVSVTPMPQPAQPAQPQQPQGR